MYIRDAYKKRGDKKYSCLVLVETIRTKKGPRQKTILTLGNIDVPREQWALLTEMLRRRLSGQRSMFPDEPEGLRGDGIDCSATQAKGEAQGSTGRRKSRGCHKDGCR